MKQKYTQTELSRREMVLRLTLLRRSNWAAGNTMHKPTLASVKDMLRRTREN